MHWHKQRSCIAARAPIEDVLQKNADYIEERAASFAVNGGERIDKFAVAFWSDNIFTYGPSCEKAVEIQQIIEKSLARDWAPLRIGSDSREALFLAGSSEDKQAVAKQGVKLPQHLKVLGSFASADAGSEANLVQLKEKVMRAFFANVGEGLDALVAGAKPSQKVKLFENSTRGVVNAAASTLCYTEAVHARLNKLQSDLMSQLCPYKKPTGATWPQWLGLRKQWSEARIKERWGDTVIKRQRAYYHHVGRHTEMWPARAMKLQPPCYFRERRRSLFQTLSFGRRSEQSGRTNTRVARGHVAMRYSQGVITHSPDLEYLQPLGKGVQARRNDNNEEQILSQIQEARRFTETNSVPAELRTPLQYWPEELQTAEMRHCVSTAGG